MPRLRLSIVITGNGSIESLEGTLVSVLEHRPPDCEILVALDQPYADPYELKGEVRFLPCTGARACESVNRAVADAKAPFVHLLASGCEATEGWTSAALSRFGDRRVAAVAPLVFDRDQPERILAAGVGYWRCGRRYFVGRGQSELADQDATAILGPASLAAFYRKAAWDIAGGLCPGLGIAHADVNLATSLRRAGFKTAYEPQSQLVAARGAEVAESAFRRALYDERLFWRNLQGARGRAIAKHALRVAGELLVSLPRPRLVAQLAAHALGCCQIAAYAKRRRELAELARGSAAIEEPRTGMRIDSAHEPKASQLRGSRAHAR